MRREEGTFRAACIIIASSFEAPEQDQQAASPQRNELKSAAVIDRHQPGDDASSPAPPLHFSTMMMQTAWERDDTSFILVAPVARCKLVRSRLRGGVGIWTVWGGGRRSVSTTASVL